MAELFQTTPQNVTLHLKAIFAEGELDEEATCKDYLQVRSKGGRDVTRNLRHYRLEVILAVGYRVRSQRGTQFRQWATARLAEYLVKGFTLDDERLKNPGQPDYFDELLARIRDIRASERRVYLRVRDILALAADYAPSAAETQRMFQTVQNKLHFAATGLTAPELIVARANPCEPNLGTQPYRRHVPRFRRGPGPPPQADLLERLADPPRRVPPLQRPRSAARSRPPHPRRSRHSKTTRIRRKAVEIQARREDVRMGPHLPRQRQHEAGTRAEDTDPALQASG